MLIKLLRRIKSRRGSANILFSVMLLVISISLVQGMVTMSVARHQSESQVRNAIKNATVAATATGDELSWSRSSIGLIPYNRAYLNFEEVLAQTLRLTEAVPRTDIVNVNYDFVVFNRYRPYMAVTPPVDDATYQFARVYHRSKRGSNITEQVLPFNGDSEDELILAVDDVTGIALPADLDALMALGPDVRVNKLKEASVAVFVDIEFKNPIMSNGSYHVARYICTGFKKVTN